MSTTFLHHLKTVTCMCLCVHLPHRSRFRRCRAVEMNFQAVVDWMDIAAGIRAPVQSSGGAACVSNH